MSKESKAAAQRRMDTVIVPIIILVLAIGSIEFIITHLIPWLAALVPSLPLYLLHAILLSVSLTPVVYFMIKRRNASVLSNKANLRNKLVTSAGLPLIIAISLMLNIVIQKEKQISTLQFTQIIVNFDIAFGKFIDAYNKEIELSMLLLINNDDSIKKNLQAQRKLVDNLSPQVKDYLLNKGVYVGRIERSYIKTFEQNLALMRKNVDDGSVTWQYIINFFVASNKDMLSRLNTFSEQIINKDINKRHVNFLTLIKIKSIINVTRVVLTAATYNAKHDKFDEDIRPLKRSVRLKNNQEKTYFDIFTSSLVEEYKADILQKLNQKVFKDSLIRQEALEERKTEQLSAQLEAYLGYNGLIHQFKNYLLRGNEEYLNSFVTLNEKIVIISNDLRKILQYDVKAIKYLDTFNEVMNEYNAKISLIKTLLWAKRLFNPKNRVVHKINKILIV